MSFEIRVMLIVAAVITSTFIVTSIRRSRMLIGDSLYWFFFAVFLVIMAIWPNLIIDLSKKLKVMSTSNLVFLIVIGLLIIRIFQMDMHISQLNTKINHLVQELGIKEHDEVTEEKSKH